MDNQNNNGNNNIIRSKNISGGYESLDDEYTKEDIAKERNMAMMNSEMNKMNNIAVDRVEEPKKENVFTNLKNKGTELFNKVRGDAHTNLSSSELRKMELQNKMDAKASSIPVQQPSPQVQQRPQQVQQPRPQVQQMPQQVQQRPQQVQQMPQKAPQQVQQPINVNNKVNNNANINSKKDVFAGLPANNAPKKGFLANFFNKGGNNNQTQNKEENVEPWMLNQPLSAQSLGVSQNEIKKEVEVHDDNSKYFNASSNTDRVGEDNRLKPENFAKPLFEKKVKPGKELEKKKNGTLLRYYLGSSYDSISMGVFSLSALIFGGLYLIANRLLLIGLGVFAAQAYILCFIPWHRGIIYYAVLALALAFVSNPLILFIANNKIKIIRRTHPKFVEEQLEVYVKRKNKSYSGLALLVFLVTIGFTTYMFVVNHYKFSGPIGIGYKYIEKLYTNYTKSEVINIEYDDKVNIDEYFTFKLSDDYKKEDNNYKYTSGEGEYNYCTVSIRKVSNFNNSNALLQAIKSLNKASGKIETEEINGIVYAKFDYSTNNGKYNYLSIKNKETLFIISHFIGKDTPQNVCDNMFGEFKDSLNVIKENEEEKK